MGSFWDMQPAIVWLYQAKLEVSGVTTEPKVRGSNPLGRAETCEETLSRYASVSVKTVETAELE